MRAQNDIKIAYFRDNLRFGLRLDFVRPETHSFAPASSFGFFHLFVYCVYNGIADSRLNGFLDFFWDEGVKCHSAFWASDLENRFAFCLNGVDSKPFAA